MASSSSKLCVKLALFPNPLTFDHELNEGQVTPTYLADGEVMGRFFEFDSCLPFLNEPCEHLGDIVLHLCVYVSVWDMPIVSLISHIHVKLERERVSLFCFITLGNLLIGQYRKINRYVLVCLLYGGSPLF